MKKNIFILPYFGKFNNYFQLFLNSCEKNSDFDWLIFTNDRSNFKYPKNVKVIYLSFDDFIDKVQKKLGFDVDLTDSHKLCDFKPCYGFLFDEYIIVYDYRGFCDCDVLIGDLKKFINHDTFQNC